MKSANLFVLLSLVSFLSACGGGGGGSSPAAGASSARLIPSSIAQSSSLSTASVAPVSSLAASSSLGNSSSSPVSSLYPDYNTSPLAADATGMGSTAVQVASKIKLGFNFGNTLEAIGGETAWGNPLITEAQVQWVKEAGFDAIRLPVAWDQYANQQTAAISLEWLNRVKQVVGYAVDNNLYVIVNIHWDGGWLENNVTTDKQLANNAKQKAFWQQIATHLRDFDEHLIFASANEPNVDNAAQMAVLNSYHQTFVDAVRATGGKNANRVLVLQGPKTDIEETDRLWTGMPSDSATNKLMAEVHFYTPFNFTLMTKDESWGKQFYYWGQGFHSATDTERNASWGQEAWVDQMFDLMKTRFVDQGIPVILGEYSAMRRDNLTGEALELHLASRAYYFRYVTERANTKGLIPFVWDTGSLFSRSNLVVTDQRVLDALLQGAGKTSSAAASPASAMSPAANSR
jgi:hypothetical protein